MRFPEFEGEWEEKRLGEVAEIVGGGTPDTTIEEYWNGNIQWFTPSEIKASYVSKSERTITELGVQKSSAKLLPIGAILLTTRATIGETAITKNICTTNQGFQSLIVNKQSNNIFIANWIKRNTKELVKRSNGSTFLEINKSEIEKIPISIPSKVEQNKIAIFLSLIDERIEAQRKIIEDLELLKSAIRDKVFRCIERTSTTKCQIKDLLNYEQPTEYIVEDTAYTKDSTLTPVLTANKAFILGYTDERHGIYNKGNCIIFDDFTMDLKYVTFPFKVKSSAIKILFTKNDSNSNLEYIYEYLQFLKLQSGEHKRHYISEVQSFIIPLVEGKLQDVVASVLLAFDDKIKMEYNICDLLEKQKKYLLKELFI